MTSDVHLTVQEKKYNSIFSIILNFKVLLQILVKLEKSFFNDFCFEALNLFYLTFLYLKSNPSNHWIYPQKRIHYDYYYDNYFSTSYLNLLFTESNFSFFVNNYSIMSETMILDEATEEFDQELLISKNIQNNKKLYATNYLLSADSTPVNVLSLHDNISKINKLSYSHFETEVTQGQLIFKNLGYLRLMQQEYVSSIFGEKLIFITNNYLSYIPLPFLKEQGLLLVNSFGFLKRTRVGSRLIAIVLSFLRFKDPELVMYAIIDTFEHMHYSKHKLLFRLWCYLITIFPKVYMNFYRVGGLKLEFRGKLAVGGNSKKRAYLFKVGLNSNSSKITKTLLKQGVIRTATGVLSCNLSVYY